MFGHILVFAFIFIARSESTDVENILGCTIIPSNHANNTCVNTDVNSFSFISKLTGIDIGVTRASHITSLFLASEFMYYVPNNIFKFFPNVSEIEIHTAIPQLIKIEKQHFHGLAKLRKLFIVGQRLRHIGHNVFEGAPAITDLFLPSNQIQSISDRAFSGLVECKHLMLNGNQLKTLKPGTFAPMTKLWSVNLSKNRIMILTESTFASNKVTVLDLSHNKIESIPDSIVKDFMESKEPKKLLNLRGNICDNRIYTKDSHRFDKLSTNCVKGIKYLPDSELIERLREEIKILELTNAVLDLENDKLKNETVRLNSELTKMESSPKCNEEMCRIMFNHIWQPPFKAVQNIIPKINFWQENSQNLFTVLATIYGDGTCMDPAPNVTKNDCADQKQLDLITSVEDRVLSLTQKMKALKGQNIALKNLVQEIVNNPVTCPPEIICPVPEPPPVCEICPETTTLGPVYCPPCECPSIIIPPVQCKPCYGPQPKSQAATTTSLYEEDCAECQSTLASVEEELTILRAVNSTYYKKTFKTSCGIDREIEELDRIILEQAIEKERMMKEAHLKAAELWALKKEAAKAEITSQKWLTDNFNLKEENADCTSMRQIDLIETTSKVSKTLIAEKDRILEKVSEQLRRIIGEEAASRRKASGEEFDFRHEAFEDVTEVAVVDHKKQISDNLKTLLVTVKLKYEQLKEGDARIQKLIAEVSRLVTMAGSSMVRRGMIANKIDQVNSVIVRTVETLENLLQAQYDMLRKTSEQIEDLISTSISKIWSILSRRASVNDEKLTLLQPLNGLNKTLIEKDKLLRSQFDKIEKYIAELKEARLQLDREYAEYMAKKKNVKEITELEELDDDLQYTDRKNQACIDLANKELEKINIAQLTRIGTLREEYDVAAETMAKMKKLFKDLLKQCTSCRSFMSRGAGFIQKLFGSTSGCDFTAYEKKHLSIFN